MMQRYFYVMLLSVLTLFLVACAPQDFRMGEKEDSALVGEAFGVSLFRVVCQENNATLMLTYINRTTNTTFSTQTLPRFSCGRGSSGANVSYERSCSPSGVLAITQTVVCSQRCEKGHCVQSSRRSVVGVDTSSISTNVSVSRGNGSKVNVSRLFNGTTARPLNVSKGIPLGSSSLNGRNASVVTINSTVSSLACGVFTSSEQCSPNSSCSWIYSYADGRYECSDVLFPHSCDFYNEYGEYYSRTNYYCENYNDSCSWIYSYADRRYECSDVYFPHSCDFYTEYSAPYSRTNYYCEDYNDSCGLIYNSTTNSYECRPRS